MYLNGWRYCGQEAQQRVNNYKWPQGISRNMIASILHLRGAQKKNINLFQKKKIELTQIFNSINSRRIKKEKPKSMNSSITKSVPHLTSKSGWKKCSLNRKHAMPLKFREFFSIICKYVQQQHCFSKLTLEQGRFLGRQHQHYLKILSQM